MLSQKLGITFCYRVGLQLRSRSHLFQNTIGRRTVMSGHSSQDPQRSDPNADGREADDSEKSQPNGLPIHALKRANLQVTEDSSPVCARVIHPGLTPDAFFLNGQPEIARLLDALTTSRVYALNMPVNKGQAFFEYDKITSGKFAFINAALIDIFPGMYDLAVPKSPLEVKVQGGHIGRTSLSTVSTVTSPADPDRQTLMTQISQVVVVDKITRRPTPIDDHWRNKYQEHCIRGEPVIVKRQELPQSGPLSVYETKSAWSDIDFYGHTSFSRYPRFALNAVHDALRTGQLEGHLSEEAFKRGVRQVKMAYLGESKEGDVLRIQVWAGGESDRCLVCSMEKEGQVICQATLTF